MVIKKMDLLSVTEGVLVHQVNMQGVMNAGLAAQIRKKYPKVYAEYMEVIGDGDEILLGDFQFVQVEPNLWVVNMFSQNKYGGGKEHTSYMAMAYVFPIVREFAKERGLQVYLPYKIGCGLGGGNWSKVSKLIEEFLPEAIICKKE